MRYNKKKVNYVDVIRNDILKQNILYDLRLETKEVYFHRNYMTGELELNITFNNNKKIQSYIDENKYQEIGRNAIWE